ncbi:MAG TPA: hypothetical protein VGM77_11220 [Gemmatimonadales bacterium]|jgi:predicted DNA-binding protein
MKRPSKKYPARINLVVTRATLRKLKSLAKKNGESVSGYVRNLIEKGSVDWVYASNSPEHMILMETLYQASLSSKENTTTKKSPRNDETA